MPWGWEKLVAGKKVPKQPPQIQMDAEVQKTPLHPCFELALQKSFSGMSRFSPGLRESLSIKAP